MLPSRDVLTGFGRIAAAFARLRNGCRRAVARVRTSLGDFGGPVRTFLFGRRAAASVLVAALGVVLAGATAWGVASTTGYPPLERWLGETWSGTEPHAIVFLGAGLLVALAAASAASNAGLLPTAALVAGPLFGVGLTRYGTVVSTGYGQYVVSLPEAVAFASAVAAVGGAAVTVVGYAVGAGLRRAVRVVRADPEYPARQG
ncbi:hypothetical protein [Haloplanus sp. C73]|uniref:hypothetical protein n=1 Tax=Haloplanus sp. C73 TaxID=3421641 RepID=UPI003EB75AE2